MDSFSVRGVFLVRDSIGQSSFSRGRAAVNQRQTTKGGGVTGRERRPRRQERRE